MNSFTTTMTSKGQVTVPVEVRRELGFHPSDTVRVRAEKGRVVMEKNDYWQEFARLQKKVQKHRKAKGITSLSVREIEALRDQAWGSKG